MSHSIGNYSRLGGTSRASEANLTHITREHGNNVIRAVVRMRLPLSVVASGRGAEDDNPPVV
ncbi:hypothetical protein [Homoserinimonas sp. OAct 916]|uniref:hypothetical protein n=1 Tax=Homoserinimonas sp. OAct 916 TaxID=2211450 RepID=UPI000DBE0E1E|nr:hypothetical protein [Homoserinimonas sp. OAct 916]